MPYKMLVVNRFTPIETDSQAIEQFLAGLGDNAHFIQFEPSECEKLKTNTNTGLRHYLEQGILNHCKPDRNNFFRIGLTKTHSLNFSFQLLTILKQVHLIMKLASICSTHDNVFAIVETTNQWAFAGVNYAILNGSCDKNIVKSVIRRDNHENELFPDSLGGSNPYEKDLDNLKSLIDNSIKVFAKRCKKLL